MSIQPPSIDRINVAPAIFFGLSSSEAAWVISVAFGVCVPLAIVAVVLELIGLVLAVILGFAVPCCAIYFTAQKMTAVKRGKPDMYYLHLFRAWLAKRHLRASRFITFDGHWDLGRSF